MYLVKINFSGGNSTPVEVHVSLHHCGSMLSDVWRMQFTTCYVTGQ